LLLPEEAGETPEMECLRGGRWWLLLLLGDELMGMKLAPLAVLLMMMAGGRGRGRDSVDGEPWPPLAGRGRHGLSVCAPCDLCVVLCTREYAFRRLCFSCTSKPSDTSTPPRLTPHATPTPTGSTSSTTPRSSSVSSSSSSSCLCAWRALLADLVKQLLNVADAAASQHSVICS